MQGPRRKWKPRIALLTLSLALTAAAHLLAAMVGFLASVALMLYLAERRRSAVLVIATYAALGAGIVEFAMWSFHPQAFTYVFTGGAGRFWFWTDGVRGYVQEPANWPALIAVTVSLLLYVGVRRSRYFGNAVSVHLRGRGLRGRVGDEATQDVSDDDGDGGCDAGAGMLGHAARGHFVTFNCFAWCSRWSRAYFTG
jgi:hypothetical protein